MDKFAATREEEVWRSALLGPIWEDHTRRIRTSQGQEKGRKLEEATSDSSCLYEPVLCAQYDTFVVVQLSALICHFGLSAWSRSLTNKSILQSQIFLLSKTTGRILTMFFLYDLDRTITLHPSYFGPHMRDYLIHKLLTDVEGTCTGRYYIICVLDAYNISPGKIIPSSGVAEFTVNYRAVVWRPFKGETVSEYFLSVIGFYLLPWPPSD